MLGQKHLLQARLRFRIVNKLPEGKIVAQMDTIQEAYDVTQANRLIG